MNATNIIIIKEYIDDNLWLIIIIILFKFYFYLYIYIKNVQKFGSLSIKRS